MKALMRATLLGGFLTLVSVAVLVNSATAKITKEDFAALWLFDGGSGDVLKDSSGNGNDGKIIGAKWTDGKFNKALEFDATAGDRVEVPDSASLNLTDQITISAWGYLADTGGNRRFLQKSTPGSDDQYRLLLEWGDFKFDAGPGVSPKEVTTPIFSAKEWHHVAGVYDGKEIALYIDGKKVVHMDATGKMTPSTGPIFIGTKWQGAPAGDHWNGKIDEVAILKRGLTEAEVNDAMKGFGNILAVEPVGKVTTTWATIKERSTR